MISKFIVVEKSTGKLPDEEQLALKYHPQLMYCDMEGFAIQEDGTVILCDECGNFDYVDLEEENLKIIWRPE